MNTSWDDVISDTIPRCYIMTTCKQLCAPTDAVHQQARVMRKMDNVSKKIPICHTLPHVFGSALTSRAFNRFNVQ